MSFPGEVWRIEQPNRCGIATVSDTMHVVRIGVGGKIFGVRAGISNRGIGMGLGPVSAGTSWRGGPRWSGGGHRPRRGGGSSVNGIVVLLLFPLLLFAIPILIIVKLAPVVVRFYNHPVPLVRWQRRFGTAISGTALFGIAAVACLVQTEYKTAAGQLLMAGVFGLWLAVELALRKQVENMPVRQTVQQGHARAGVAAAGSAQPIHPAAVQPGWYPDQCDHRFLRWWDGRQWTAHTQPAYRPQRR